MKELTAEKLRSLYHYNPETGVFTRLMSLGSRGAGPAPGGLDSGGYRRLQIEGQRYLMHRLAWLYMHGCWPEHHVDHINGIRDDNRIENLRVCSIRENNLNTRISKNNRSGFKGVSLDKKANYWTAGIHIDRKRISLGRFETAMEAAHAYNKAAIKHYGEFAVLNPVGV